MIKYLYGEKILDNKTRATEYLSKDLLKNCNLISPLQISDDIKFVYAENDGVCFVMCDSNIVFLSTSRSDIAKKVISKLENVELCVASNKFEADMISTKFGLKKIIPCYQVLYNTEKIQPVNEKLEIKKLDKNLAEFVALNYSMHPETEEVCEIMDRFGIYGAYVDGEIAGFIGKHQEGSIGMLEVFPDYRKQGIGTSLINFMVNLCKSNHQIAYGQIMTTNTASFNLHKTLDCTFSDELVYWCFT